MENSKGAWLKTAIKAVTTPGLRDDLKRAAFYIYASKRKCKRPSVTERPFGINLIGPIRGDFGLGESCRLVADAIKSAGIPLSIYNISMNGSAVESDLTWKDYESNQLPYAFNLIHINPNVLTQSLWKLRKQNIQQYYNIAYWLWEIPEFPKEWMYAFKIFDEIWTPTVFIADALKKCTHKPVCTMRYALRTPHVSQRYDRAYFGLPEKPFLFMLSYDGNSVSERKNPWGAIRAYRNAFMQNETGVGLVIKATHASTHEIQSLTSYLSGYRNIVLLQESYTKEEFNSLLACVNTYVSLHRAEGFGLVMAEAMLLGVPTIATNWSANTEFMNPEVACMIPASVIALEQDIPPYKAGNHWADPDETVASEYMRRLYEDRVYGCQLAQKAYSYIKTQFAPELAGNDIWQRLNKVLEDGKTK